MSTQRFAPRFAGLYRSLLFNIVLPLAVVQIVTHRGMPLVTALAISAVFPITATIVEAIRGRAVDLIAAISLIFIVGGVIASLYTHDPRLALAKESFGTGLLGLVCLASLAAPRPLMFYFGRQFATGGDAARRAEWNALWSAPFFRFVQRTITVVWGIAWLCEAALRVVCAYTIAPTVTLIVSPLLSLATTLLLVLWTIRFSHWATRRGEALRAASLAGREARG